MPYLRGKSVLDIGAWDGKYSFEAERAGAARVVALDHYVWRLDPVARQAYYDECQRNGVLPDSDMVDNGFLMDRVFRAKRVSISIHEYLSSKVETVVDDFSTMDLDTLRVFDVVFYFGVLYHIVSIPSGAEAGEAGDRGRRGDRDTRDHVPGYEESSLVEFYAGDELHADSRRLVHSRWCCATGMCRAAGSEESDQGEDPDPADTSPQTAQATAISRQLPDRGARLPVADLAIHLSGSYGRVLSSFA